MAFGNFELSIHLGNAAMANAEDVADALDDVASRLREGSMGGKIRDNNGNSVGQFDLDLDLEEEESDDDLDLEEESDDDDGQDVLEESE